MIRKLLVTDPGRACVPWWHKVDSLKGRETFEFEPGLNILWGPNGSGKSTVIKAIARALHCEQGGVQVVTQHSHYEMFCGGTYAMKNGVRFEGYSDGVLPSHDGSPVAYFDPSVAVGIIWGSLDNDFFDLGLMNTIHNVSAGQTTMMRGEHTMRPIFRGTPPPAVEWRVPMPEADPPENDWGRERWEHQRAIQATLNGTLKPTGIPTILLDEPDRSLDVPIQHKFWTNVGHAGLHGHVQIIAASHSVFALEIPGAHYIEFENGYLERSRRAAKAHAAVWLDELVKLRAEFDKIDKPAKQIVPDE